MRLKNLLILSCVLVVIGFTALCFRAVFSVASINIDYSYYTDSEVDNANRLLSHYYGANLLFVDTDKVVNLVNENTSLKVESVKKNYPNVLEIKLKQRQERFAIKTSDGYFILDEEWTVVDKRDNLKNSVDNLDNILLTFQNAEFDASILQIRSTLTIGRDDLLNAVTSMVNEISSPRDFIKEIVVVEKEKGVNFYVNFLTFEGVTIEVRKALLDPKQKITLGVEKYESLFDRDKLSGKVAVYSLDSGEIVATYSNQN